MPQKPSVYLVYVSLLVWLGCAQSARAVPFPLFDARSAAMGQANIAQGIRNAAFYNPALAAIDTDEYDWYVMVPSSGEAISDPDKVKNGVQDIVNGTGNAAQILSDITNKDYQKYHYNTAQITIPSPFLGGAAYVAKYGFQTEKVVTDSINTFLEHRALDVFETGISVAQLQDVLWMQNLLVGITAKMMLIESYGYQEPIATADFSLDSDAVKRAGVLNLDFGIAKEYGVWKTALVVKNLYPQDKKFGNSDHSYHITPQVKSALAYESRRNVIEFDLDLTKNSGVGFSPDTRYAAVGWEWRMFQSFNFRLGYQQNLVDDKIARFSGGIGLNLWGVLLDASATTDKDGSGTYLQASWQF